MNNSTEQVRIGIDLGGTKIELIALDRLGRTLQRTRVPTPVGNYRGTVETIRQLVSEFETTLDQQATVGIGMPGALSRMTGRVKNSNSICLNGQPFKEDLEFALNRQIQIENDANCLALSEAVDGAAAGMGVVFAVILGTGVGGGIVVDKKCLSGPNAIAGEWGHNPLPWPLEEELQNAALCYCGKKGCIETWLSGAGLSREFQHQTHQQLEAVEIAKLIERSDEVALQAFNVYSRRLAKSLASVINVIDPDVIVLGGGLSNLTPLYQFVPELWGEYVFSDRVDTVLRQAVHDDSSGVRGAAWLGAI